MNIPNSPDIHSPIGNPKDLEAAARQLQSTDPSGAQQLFAEAAAAFRHSAGNAYTICAWLRNARRSGCPSSQLLEEAMPFLEKFDSVAAVRQGIAWIHYDMAREALDARRFADAADALSRMIALFAPTDNATVHADIAALFLTRLVKTRQEVGRGIRADAFADLRRQLRIAADAFLCAVSFSANPSGNATNRKAISRGEILCFAIRRLALETGDGPLLSRYMEEAVRRFPRNEWFQSAFIRGALLEGDPRGALARGEAASKVLPGALSVAQQRADALKALDRPAEALELLLSLAHRGRSPWIWQEIASLQEQMGDLQAAADSLATGLAFQDARDPGKVWRLHQDRARCLLLLGDPDGSATEAFLAREARNVAGWRLDRDQAEFLESQKEVFADRWAVLEAMAQGDVRRAALENYRKARRRGENGDAATKSNGNGAEGWVSGQVQWFDAQKNFGLVKVADGRTAFLHGSVLKGRTLEAGEHLSVRCVTSFDAKKKREGWKVVRVK